MHSIDAQCDHIDPICTICKYECTFVYYKCHHVCYVITFIEINVKYSLLTECCIQLSQKNTIAVT